MAVSKCFYGIGRFVYTVFRLGGQKRYCWRLMTEN
jgi:hypothetical protein